MIGIDILWRSRRDPNSGPGCADRLLRNTCPWLLDAREGLSTSGLGQCKQIVDDVATVSGRRPSGHRSDTIRSLASFTDDRHLPHCIVTCLQQVMRGAPACLRCTNSMAPASRFTTSKFRNAQLHPSSRAEVLRGHLPFSASAASTTGVAANSTFSSEIKTNTDWIVTVSPAGDVSFRSGSFGDVTGTAKAGSSGVGDWDLSTLNDGVVAIGGLDGRVSALGGFELILRSRHIVFQTLHRVSLSLSNL